MKKISLILLTLIISIPLLGCTDKARIPAIQKKEAIANELLVKFNQDVPVEKKKEIIAHCNGEIIKHLDGIDVYHIKTSISASDTMRCLKAHSELKYVEPNRVYSIPPLPRN